MAPIKTLSNETDSFVSHAREEGLMYTAMNRETGHPALETLRLRLLEAHRELANALHLDPNGA